MLGFATSKEYMIITRTPFRVSFFGGGTDYPDWFAQHGGKVLAVTVNKYCYLTARFLPPFLESKHRIVWSRIEMVGEVADIQHPSVRASLQFMGIDEGVEIHHYGDLPARSGLGSSSAFTVGCLHALHGLRGRLASKRQLAKEAIHVEQKLLHEAVGVQDQIQVAHGGLNAIEILPDGEFRISPLFLSRERVEALEGRLLLYFTGISRYATEIAKAQIDAIPAKGSELSAMRALVDPAIDVLSGSGDLAEFGRMLHESWLIKRGLSDRITNERIDGVYDAARRAGATGGKLLGAGGGGFILFYVEPERQASVRQALAELLEVPFSFEFGGTQTIFFDHS